MNPMLYAELPLTFSMVVALDAKLADFFMGAHAAVAGLPVLTRDVRRYAGDFLTVRLIAL